MELKKISRWVVIGGALLILIVKLGIRPACDCNQALRFSLGIAPNLISSFLVPFFASLLFSNRDSLLAKIFSIHSLGDLRQVCLLGFGFLVINEYMQLIPFFGRTFDYFDLVFSAVGLTASYFIFGKIYTKIFYSYYPD
ncbi:MAG TPA: hypothetical protein VI548_09710 [Chitinophagaceae bacterium]|nr:hypothetical protein [Chitinophagaceae bacterium]